MLFLVTLCACTSSEDDRWSHHATQIAVAGNASCALEEDGRVACWGTSTVLQRGTTTTGGEDVTCVDPFVPSDAIGVFCANPFGMHVDTELRFVEISADFDDTICGRTAAGAVHCWPGFSTPGQGQVVDYSKSVEVSGSISFASIVGWTHGVIGVAADGPAYTAMIDGAPIPVPGEHHFTQLRGGDNVWVGIDGSGTVLQGDFASTNPEEQFAPLAGATLVTTGGHSYYHNGCAINADARVWCWGAGYWGMLGDGTLTGRTDAAPISSTSTYKDVASSAFHVCAVTTAGDVDCWGWNSEGQSGPTTQTCADGGPTGTEWPCTDTPVRIVLPGPASSVRVGAATSCALLADATVWCWGLNTAGQLGRGSVGANFQNAEQVQ